MAAVPEWMRPPRLEGWYADDLDRLPEAPRHTELIDGALVFMISPQRAWHGRAASGLLFALAAQAPAGVEVEPDMTIRLDKRNRPSRHNDALRPGPHFLPARRGVAGGRGGLAGVGAP